MRCVKSERGAHFDSHYNALQLKVIKRYSDFNLLLNYTYSKATSNGSSSQAATDILAPQNAYSLSNEDGFHLYDAPHVLNLIYTWDLPIGRGKRLLDRSGKLATAVASGWTLAACRTDCGDSQVGGSGGAGNRRGDYARACFWRTVAEVI